MDKKSLLIHFVLTVGLDASAENAVTFVDKLNSQEIQRMLEALDPTKGVEKALYATDTTGSPRPPAKVA